MRDQAQIGFLLASEAATRARTGVALALCGRASG